MADVATRGRRPLDGESAVGEVGEIPSGDRRVTVVGEDRVVAQAQVRKKTRPPGGAGRLPRRVRAPAAGGSPKGRTTDDDRTDITNPSTRRVPWLERPSPYLACLGTGSARRP